MGELVDYGEQFERKLITGEASRPSQLTIGLFDQSTDGLSDTNDVGDITTELDSTLSYSRQTVSFDSTALQTEDLSGNWAWNNANSVIFSIADNTAQIDSYFVAVTYQAQNDASATQHLYFFGDLSQTYSDTTDIDELKIEVGGIGLKQD